MKILIPKQSYGILRLRKQYQKTFDPIRAMTLIAIGLILLAFGLPIYRHLTRSLNLMNNSIVFAYFTAAYIGFPLVFLWEGALSFYAPRWAQRLERKLFLLLTWFNRAQRKEKAELRTLQRFALSVCILMQIIAVGTVGVGIQILLTAAVGLFAPPYAGPIPPVTALQQIHSEATQLWQTMANRPVLYIVLVGVLIGSWMTIRVCRSIRKRITGDGAFFPRFRPLA